MSDLKFNAVEKLSTCAREPPLDVPTPELINVHTVRVLQSMEAQIRLLALPARPFNHSPFVTCMISEGTLGLLSACKFLFKKKELVIARDQIRLAIGCLKTLAEVWPRTARNLQEIQTIARHVLGLVSEETECNTPIVSQAQNISEPKEGMTPGFEDGMSQNDILSSFDVVEGVCGWYNLGGMDIDLSWLADE